MNRMTANLTLLLAGLIWGLGFVAQSTAMAKLGPWTYTGIRFLIAALALAPLAWLEMRRRPARLTRRQRLGFCAIGLFLFAGSILQQIGMVTTNVTNAAFLTGLYVVLTPLLALALFRVRPHPVVLVAAPLAFAGIAMMGGARLGPLSQGDLLTIVGANFWALQILFISRFAADTGRPFGLSCTQFTVAGAAALAGGLALEPLSLPAISAAMPEILFAGLVSGAIGFTIQIVAQQYTSGPQAAVMLSSETLFAGLFGALLLGERLGPTALAGCALIFLSMLLVEMGPLVAARLRAGRASPN